jgi:magnesium transporter
VKEQSEIQTKPLLCVLVEDTLITVTKDPFVLYDSIVRKLSNEQQLTSRGVLLQLLSQVNIAYNASLTVISKDIRKYQRKEGKIKNVDILRFVHIENTLYDLSTSLLRMETIYGVLKNHEMFTANEGEKDAFEDILLETQEIEGLMKASIRTITNIRDAYTIILTNNLNRVIKMFTSFTVVLTIPVLIASFYGMNVTLPYQEHSLAFFGIVSLCAGLTIATFVAFIKKDWI